jgi:rhodanese-related sulfurtransferase
MIARTTPPVIDVAGAVQLMHEHPDVRVIDVRTPEEFASAHIPGSQNIPLDTLARRPREVASKISSPVIIVCRSSARAYLARELLRSAGVSGLHVLDGGILAWAATGRDLIVDRAK